MMIHHVNPKTMEIQLSEPDTMPAEWVQVEPSPCGRWFDVAEGMVLRRIINPENAELQEAFYFSALLTADGNRLHIGPVDAEFVSKQELARRLAEFAKGCGGELITLVFHADPHAMGGRKELQGVPAELLNELMWDIFR